MHSHCFMLIIIKINTHACSHVHGWMALPAGWDKVRAKGEFESLHGTWLVGQLSVQLGAGVPCLGEGYTYMYMYMYRENPWALYNDIVYVG